MGRETEAQAPPCPCVKRNPGNPRYIPGAGSGSGVLPWIVINGAVLHAADPDAWKSII